MLQLILLLRLRTIVINSSGLKRRFVWWGSDQDWLNLWRLILKWSILWLLKLNLSSGLNCIIRNINLLRNNRALHLINRFLNIIVLYFYCVNLSINCWLIDLNYSLFHLSRKRLIGDLYLWWLELIADFYCRRRLLYIRRNLNNIKILLLSYRLRYYMFFSLTMNDGIRFYFNCTINSIMLTIEFILLRKNRLLIYNWLSDRLIIYSIIFNQCITYFIFIILVYILWT